MAYYLSKIYSMMARLLLLSSIVLLTACLNFERPSRVATVWYLVKPSDTLYSIAWRYDVDFKALAVWNKIQSPYIIWPGQYLRLIKPHNIKISHARQKQIKKNPSTKTIKKTKNQAIHWLWPVKGSLLNKFSFNDIDKRGINIASKLRQPVLAVASGKVVYSGNGLEGYKNLIIIKHNEIYLSAYAQNKNLLVKEGDIVKKGKKIADIGVNNEHKFLLHFQIRKNGKPIDPLRYLPKI